MPGEWTNDFLSVARLETPPASTVLTRALAGSGCGQAAYEAASAPAAGAPSGGRQRLGVYILADPQGSASGRIVVARHDTPVLTGMGETPFNTLARGLGADDIATLREGCMALDMRVTVLGERATPALTWATRVLLIMLGITEGVALDPAAQRAYGRTQLAQLAAATQATAHIALHSESWGADELWLHTHGLQKFARPELELLGVPRAFEAEGRTLILELADNLTQGISLSAGQEVDLDDLGRLMALSVPSDVDHQAPYGRLRLVDVPEPGEQLTTGANRLLLRTVLADASRRASAGDAAGAMEDVERMLAADPDDAGALGFRARLLLRANEPLEALEVAELMQLRAPNDARGLLIQGHALARLGRAREAERAYSQAIDRNPDDAEVYEGRAAAYDQLGQRQQANADRAHAAYLKAQTVYSRS
jgi:tetratricopeptide (TPR) repeat protein